MPAISRIASGVGKHLVNNLPGRRDVAVLYSQASIRAAFIENREKEHEALRMKYIAILRNLGFGFDFVSYEQLAAGRLLEVGYKVLVLPDSTALSDAEISAVRAFAAAGGNIVAEGRPAVREANCRPRSSGALDDLFPGTRHTLFPEIDVRYGKALDDPLEAENAALIAAEQMRIEKALALDTPRLAIEDARSGEQIRDAEIYVREGADGTLFYGIVSPEPKLRDVFFRFPRKGHVYDLVRGGGHGEVATLAMPLGGGAPCAFEVVQKPIRIECVEGSPDGTVRLTYCEPCVSVALVRVRRPDGSEAECYRRKVIVRNSRAETHIPFSGSDPAGEWMVEAFDIHGTASRSPLKRQAKHDIKTE